MQTKPQLSAEMEKEFRERMSYSFIEAVIRDVEKNDKDLLNEIVRNIEPFLATALEEQRTVERIILETILEAVKGSDQRFMEEQGIFLDNRAEHAGAIKILKYLLNGDKEMREE